MATTLDYIAFVCDQLQGMGEIRYRKMFGEYMVYVNEKPLLLVCDNTVFVRRRPDKVPQVECLLEGADLRCPYQGAKEHYVLDMENREFVRAVIEALEPVIEVPKRKKR